MARELPSQGRCHASFLLAYTASLRAPVDREDWISASAARATIMAAAADLSGTADILLRSGLAKEDGTIRLDSRLAKLSAQADRISLLGIARLLLECFPPAWLFTAASHDGLARELIPQDDLSMLDWIGTDLEPLVVSVYNELVKDQDEDLRRKLGLAGELAVMSALRKSGHAPMHVALVSDRFGYDIDCAVNGSNIFYEVKSSVEATSDRIFVSRNEFDVAYRNHKNWRLVQVIFSSRVFLREVITARDVVRFRELTPNVLYSLAPPDSQHFSWQETAQFTPSTSHWARSDMELDPAFELKLGPT